MSSALHAWVGRPTEILLACEGDQRERYLLPCVRAEKRELFALTEPEAGSDIMSMKTRARRDGDDRILDGAKHFASGPVMSDFAIVFAATGVDETRRGPRKRITAFLVDVGEKGFDIAEGNRCVSYRGHLTFRLDFSDPTCGSDRAKSWVRKARGWRSSTPHPSSRIRGPSRGSRPDLVEAETKAVELCAKVSTKGGEVLRSPAAGPANLQMRLIGPGTKGVSTASRTGACPEDVIGLQFRELRTKRLNLRQRYVARREAQRERMLTRVDPRPRILSTGNEHHGAGLREVAVDRHGSANRPETGDESARVIDRQMETRQQRLRIEAGLLKGRTKRGG